MTKFYFYFSLCFLSLVVSCTSPVKIINFNANPSSIKEGESVELLWSVENADTVYIFDETTKQYIYYGQALQNRKTVTPTITTKYNISALNKSYRESNSIVVSVEPSYPEIQKPVVKEELNETTSEYLAGLKNILNVEPNTRLIYRILSFDRTHYPDSIFIKVIVQDEKGNFISNLAPPYGDIQTRKKFFKQIIESIELDKQVIEDFSVLEYHNQYVEPCNFSLVLDYSGSMYGENGEPIKALEKSTREFITKKRMDDKLSVVKFDHIIINEVPLTNNDNVIRNQIKFDGLKRFGGATALYAAGDFGLKTLSSVNNNKYLILFTDGSDNSSMYYSLLNNLNYATTASELIYKARELNTKIYTIGFGYAEQKILKKMAVLGDGAFYWADDGKEIEQIYSELPRIFQNYYQIVYKPTQKEGYHEIVIKGSNLDGSESHVEGTTFIGDKFDFPDEITTRPQVVAFFNLNDAVVKPEFKETIMLFVNYLNVHKNYNLKIIGHTDLRGSDAVNKNLSRKRANNVASIFIKKGIEKSRIEVIGKGKEQPLYPVEDYSWQADGNRRVELILYEK